MRYTQDHAETTRARVLAACERAFREHGYGGIGVEGLARAAGVTSGALYNHFGAKSGAFLAVVAAGVERLRQAVAGIQAVHGARWLPVFARYYLGAAHRADVAGGCALPSLSAEVSRADGPTRAAYEEELLRVAALISSDRAAAWPLLASVVGGVVLARAVADPALAEEIAAAVLRSIETGSPPA